MKYYSLFTYNSLRTTPARPLSLSRSVLSRALLSLYVLRRRVRGRGEDEGGGCGGECEGRVVASRACQPSSPVPGERRHRVDPAMAVEEARSGPSGIGFRSRPTQVTSSAVFNPNCTRSYKSLSLILCLIRFGFFECVRFISASFCV